MSNDPSTRVPASIDALRALGETIEDLLVLDGPSEDAYVETDVLAVGISSDDDTPAIDVYRERVGLGSRYRESATISCEISSWTGDTSMKERRDRCAEILDQLDQAMQADRTLGGAVDECRLAEEMRWVQGVDESGAGAAVQFGVTYTAAL